MAHCSAIMLLCLDFVVSTAMCDVSIFFKFHVHKFSHSEAYSKDKQFYYITYKIDRFSLARASMWPVHILSYYLASMRLPVYISN